MQSLLGLPFSLQEASILHRGVSVSLIPQLTITQARTNQPQQIASKHSTNHPGQDCLYPWSTMHKQLIRVSSMTLPDSHGYSLAPRPPPFFVVRFAFSIIHGSGRAQKTGKAWSHSSREWTQGGHRDEGPNHKNNALVHPFKRSTAVLDLRR